MKKRKWTLVNFAIALVIAVVLSGCGPGKSGSASSSGGLAASSKGTPTVTVWSWRSQDAPLWKQVQQSLNKNGVKVNIKFRPVNPTSYDSVLQTAMDGGKGPDILYTRSGEGTLKYAAANLIEPVGNIADLSKINSGAVSSAKYKGKTYGVPFAIQTMEVFYNKDIFKKYHLSVPKTWSDFIHICKVLKSHNETPLSVMGVQNWMLALQFDEVGATVLSDQFTNQLTNKKKDYTSQPYVTALKEFQSLSPYFEPNFKAVGSGGNEQETQFALGKSAMVMDGVFDVPTIKKYNPKINMGAFLIPQKANSNQKTKIDWYTDGDIAMNSKISNSAEKKAAKKILAFTATKQFGQDFSNIAGEISPIAGVKIPSKYPLSIQAYQRFQKSPINPLFGIRSAMDTPPPVPATKKTKKAANTDTGIFSAEQKVLLPLLKHKITPEQAAKKVQQQLSWYYKK